MEKCYIYGGLRTPFCKAGSNLAHLTSYETMAAVTKEAVKRFGLEGKKIDETSLGVVMHHSADWNFARDVVIEAGLALESPASMVVRACGTGLQACADNMLRIKTGHIDTAIGGGSDSMSQVPIFHSKKFAGTLMSLSKARSMGDRLKILSTIRPSDLKPEFPSVLERHFGVSMGQGCELMAKKYGITRGEQDQLALESHQKAAKAWEEGFYDDLVMELGGTAKDNIVRGDTTLEKLSKLRPAFDKEGTLTAGNSTPLSDGASLVFLGNEKAQKFYQRDPLAELVDFEVSAVDVKREGLLMAPAFALPRMLMRNKLTFDDIDLFEVHEAFAAQTLSTLKMWESDEFCKRLGLERALGSIPKEKFNIKGGSIAIGHPFAATGGRIVASLSKMMKERKAKTGIISICTGGGMGIVALLKGV